MLTGIVLYILRLRFPWLLKTVATERVRQHVSTLILKILSMVIIHHTSDVSSKQSRKNSCRCLK